VMKVVLLLVIKFTSLFLKKKEKKTIQSVSLYHLQVAIYS
jgi:hypothetical protein